MLMLSSLSRAMSPLLRSTANCRRDSTSLRDLRVRRRALLIGPTVGDQYSLPVRRRLKSPRTPHIGQNVCERAGGIGMERDPTNADRATLSAWIGLEEVEMDHSSAVLGVDVRGESVSILSIGICFELA